MAMPSLELGDRHLTVFPERWLECEPPSNCHEIITAGLAALASSVAAPAALGATGLATEAGLGTALGFGLGTTAAPAAAASTGIFGTGIGLSEIGQVAGVGGTLLQANAGMDNAAYQAAVQRANAAALAQKANEETAAAQRVQITRNRQTELAQSRIRAVGAASGTEATSPDIVNTEGLVAQQGQYNALSALYEGQARARSDTYQQQIDLFNARRIDAGAFPAAAGTLLAGLGSFADRKRNYLLNDRSSL